MKFRRNKKDFFEFENDRKTHVKLYKAGKQWVSSLISSIGLIRVFKGRLDKSAINTQLVSKEKDKKSEDKLSSDGLTAALKGAVALGAVAGGTVLTANTALADTKQLDSNQNLVNKDTVNLSSGSGSSSTSDSLSTSESNVQPEASVSKSESVSLNTNTNSSSTSETRSDSNSRSESISESKSDSNSQSVSSQTTSKSESLASTSLENSQTTTGTTAKDKLQGLINQATDFVNSDAFKSSSSDLKTALAATVKQYATVMQSSTSLTEQDYQYGIDNLALLMNEIKSPSTSIKPNVFMTSASTSSNSTYNPVSAASDDIGSVYNTTNGLRWIYGDNKVWGRMQDVFTSRDTGQKLWMAKANFTITKDSLGNGRDHWTIKFFPKQGLMYNPSEEPNPTGLQNARFGFLLTKDYTITSNVNIQVDVDLNHPYFGNSLTKVKTTVDSTNNQASFDFAPNTDDVNKTDGHVNNRNFIGDKGSNGYIQETYYISNNVNGSQTSNLLQNRIYQGYSYDTLETEDQTARQKSRILTENGNVVGKKGANGIISKDAFGTAMYMKSYGTGDEGMYASYTISFDTLHSNKVQKNLPLGTNGGAFSGVYASVDSYQWKTALSAWRVLLGDFYGEESMKNDSTTNNNLPGFESNSKATSESKSQSTLQSTLQSQNESKSVSLSTSGSLSASTSLSESLSKSGSLSTSTSQSQSESLSTSSSLSESLSTSSSLSESLSTSSSLSKSLSGSSSMNTDESNSLSRSLSESESLSESLSISSSLSKSLSGSSSMNTDELDSISRSLSESLSTSSFLSASASLIDSLSESLSNTISSENMNDGNNGNTIVTTNPGSVNKVSSESLKHNVQHKKLPQMGDSSANTGVLGGLFVLTSLALMKAKKKKD